METVVHGVTGILVENCNDGFCDALYYLVTHPLKVDEMSIAGREYVKRNFGSQKFQNDWSVLVDTCVRRGRHRGTYLRRRSMENKEHIL